MFNNFQKGQSLIEVILAVALFVIIVSSIVMAVLGSFSSTRLAEEETQASLLAYEGIEGTKSIRNQSYANLTNGDHGLSKTGNTWSFSGSSDVNGKYTRTVNVSDGSDSETKKIISTVSWSFTPTRNNNVVYTAYLTDWQKGKTSGITPAPSTCSDYCISLGTYSGGTCRSGVSQCNANGETAENGGNSLCTVQSAGICCCAT